MDGQGQVIGISEAYIPPEAGAVAIGFAIPAPTAVSVADQLLKTGRVEHAFIGIQPAQLTPELAQELGLRETSGILVSPIGRNSGRLSRARARQGVCSRSGRCPSATDFDAAVGHAWTPE